MIIVKTLFTEVIESWKKSYSQELEIKSTLLIRPASSTIRIVFRFSQICFVIVRPTLDQLKLDDRTSIE